MNKFLVYGGGALAIVLLLIGAYFMWPKKKNEGPELKAIAPGTVLGNVRFVDNAGLDAALMEDADNSTPAMVLWYADWCPNCTLVVPAFIEASISDDKAHRWYAMESNYLPPDDEQWNVPAYPHVRKWTPERFVDGRWEGKWEIHRGLRTSASYRDFAAQ